MCRLSRVSLSALTDVRQRGSARAPGHGRRVIAPRKGPLCASRKPARSAACTHQTHRLPPQQQEPACAHNTAAASPSRLLGAQESARTHSQAARAPDPSSEAPRPGLRSGPHITWSPPAATFSCASGAGRSVAGDRDGCPTYLAWVVQDQGLEIPTERPESRPVKPSGATALSLACQYGLVRRLKGEYPGTTVCGRPRNPLEARVARTHGGPRARARAAVPRASRPGAATRGTAAAAGPGVVGSQLLKQTT